MVFESPELYVLDCEAGEFLVRVSEEEVFAFGALVNRMRVVAYDSVEHCVSTGRIRFHVYDVAE